MCVLALLAAPPSEVSSDADTYPGMKPSVPAAPVLEVKPAVYRPQTATDAPECRPPVFVPEKGDSATYARFRVPYAYWRP